MKNFSILVFSLLTIFWLTPVKAADFAGNSINLKGNSNTIFGAYEIKEVQQANLNGETLRTFELTYEKTQKPVLIYLEERANCREYVVRSKNLEVAYQCKKNAFGAKLVPYKHIKYKPEINALFLSQDEFNKQQKIADGPLPVESALGMIASYYPNLFKSTDLLN